MVLETTDLISAVSVYVHKIESIRCLFNTQFIDKKRNKKQNNINKYGY